MDLEYCHFFGLFGIVASQSDPVPAQQFGIVIATASRKANQYSNQNI